MTRPRTPPSKSPQRLPVSSQTRKFPLNFPPGHLNTSPKTPHNCLAHTPSVGDPQISSIGVGLAHLHLQHRGPQDLLGIPQGVGLPQTAALTQGTPRWVGLLQCTSLAQRSPETPWEPPR